MRKSTLARVPIAAAILALSFAWTTGCRDSASAVSRSASRTPTQAPSPIDAREETNGDLEFAPPDGATVFSLRQNVLRVGDRTVGRLSPNGTFILGETEGVTASLTDAGRVVIAASPGTDLKRIDGELGRLLRDYEGRIEAGYTIHGDGTATIARGRPLSFDAEGHLATRDLVVHGLTAQNRRRAMFVYVLLLTLAPYRE